MSENKPASHDLSADVVFALDTLVRMVERASTDLRASVLLLSDDGRLLDGAAPNLPDAYRQAINGLPIGPEEGSCGTAAYSNQRVVVTDIATDPRWRKYKDLALGHGLAACWSQPIRDMTGRVLGTFALYYGTPREPTAVELDFIEAAAARAGVILQRARAGAGRAELVAAAGG
ncbi:MAG TPA: GAF domain-containing protein [Longimicrobiales bacterium]